MKKPYLLIFFIFLVKLGFSQSYYFQNYGVKDGLLQSNVVCGIQISDGHLILGTDGGVSKFDGKEFKNFSISNGLAENNASAIFQDNDKIVWIGHQNGGVSIIEQDEISIFKDSVLSKSITKIFQDHEGNIWLCSLGDGVVKIDSKNKNNHKKYKGKEGLSDYVFNAFSDDKGFIWFVTDVGIKKFNLKSGEFEFVKIQGLPPFQITNIIQDVDNNLWIGTYQGGVYKYNFVQEELVIFNIFNGLKSNWISSIYQANDKNVWVGTWGGGVSKINTEGEVKTYHSGNGLYDDKVRFVFEDRERNIIIGTNEHGLVIFGGEEFSHYTHNEGLNDDQIWAVKKVNNKIFLATNEGLSVLENGKISNINDLDFSIRSLDLCGNKLILGTWGYGVYEYNIDTKLIKEYFDVNEYISLNVNDVCVVDDEIYIATIKGLSKFNTYTRELKHFSGIIGKVELDIANIYNDSENNIWLGTRKNGLIKYDGDKFVKIGSDKINSAPTSIVEDTVNNIIYIGTEGAGVYQLSKESINVINLKSGLISDFITGLEMFDNDLWVATNKGLSKINLKNKTISTYAKYEGFSAIETKLNAVEKSEDKLYFGTVGGLTVYKNTEKEENKIMPKTLITSIKLNHKESNIQSGVKLDYKQNSFVFEYVGINFSNPEKVNYKVKLEGWENDWNETKLQLTNYTNLSAGKYIFLVRSGNNEIGWSAEPISFSFTITPPFWKTWWFYTICIFITIIGFIFFVKWRERKLLVEKRELEEKVEERTTEVVEKSTQLEKAYSHIQSSIVYAQRIQNAILPTDKLVKECFPNSFVFFKPRDIVSGDFYWLEKTDDLILFSAIDCTGHGVPGAFVSMVGHNLLNQSVRKHNLTKPSDILDDLDAEVKKTLQTSEEASVQDGMDLSLCSYNPKTMELQYAGAHNGLYLVRNNELIEYKANRFAIGYRGRDGDKNNFTNHSISIENGDTIYLFSDGFIDQFGGENGRKYMSKKFKRLLIDINNQSLEEQNIILNKTMSDWMGDTHKQIDDILVLGIGF